MTAGPLDDMTHATERELLDYLAAEIVGRMNTLPKGFSSLFRKGVMFRDSLHMLAMNTTYPPCVDFLTTEKGLYIRFMTADGVIVQQFYFAFAEADTRNER